MPWPKLLVRLGPHSSGAMQRRLLSSKPFQEARLSPAICDRAMQVIRAGAQGFRHVDREDEGGLRRLDNGLFGEGVTVRPGSTPPQRHMLEQGGKHYLDYRWDSKVVDEAVKRRPSLRRVLGPQVPGSTENFRLVLEDSLLLEEMQTTLRPAALRVFGEEDNSEAARLSHVYLLYATLNLPGQVINLHLDVPEFLGLDRSSCPNWLLSAAHCSGLFEEQRVRNVTCVFYPQDATSGHLAVYPSIRSPRGANTEGLARVLPVEAGLVCAMDADSCFHHSEQARPCGESGPVPAPFFPGACRVEVIEDGAESTWVLRDAVTGEEVARHPEEDLRISISCKFHVFSSQAEADAYNGGATAIDGPALLAAMTDHLKSQGSMAPEAVDPTRVPLYELGPRLVEKFVLPVAPSEETVQGVWGQHRSELMQPESQEAVTILDGSTGRQLVTNGMPDDELFKKLWSAKALVDDNYHQLLVDTHRSYIDAGASGITTNSYCVQPTIYRRNFPENWRQRMVEDAELAARLAVKAREAAGGEAEGRVRVMGCLPPLCESHRPDLFAKMLKEDGEEFCIEMYRILAEALLRGGADAFLAETMNSWEEALCAVRGCMGLGLPIVISMEGALRDEQLQPQPHLAPQVAWQALALKRQGVQLEALGFNCTEPELLLEVLRCIEASPDGLAEELRREGLPLAAYANLHDRKAVHAKGFDIESATSRVILRDDLAGGGFEGYLAFTELFVKHGAQIIGGCCGCGVEGIQKMVSRLGQRTL